MQALVNRYIYPPRAKLVAPKEEIGAFASMGWVAQYKVNDSRCLVKFIGEDKIELWNRHGERFRDYHAPDWLLNDLHILYDRLGMLPDSWSLLDGGLLDKKHMAIKDTVVLWDVLVLNGDHLLRSTYSSRHNMLVQAAGQKAAFIGSCRVGYAVSDNVLVSESYGPSEDWGKMWENIDATNEPYISKGYGPLIEGLCLKNPMGLLENGFKEKNNGDWMIRSRVATNRHAF